jgi:hypothetical protein
MLLRAAATLLAVDTNDHARSALADAAARIERALPTDRARVAFRSAAPLSAVG